MSISLQETMAVGLPLHVWDAGSIFQLVILGALGTTPRRRSPFSQPTKPANSPPELSPPAKMRPLSMQNLLVMSSNNGPKKDVSLGCQPELSTDMCVYTRMASGATFSKPALCSDQVMGLPVGGNTIITL